MSNKETCRAFRIGIVRTIQMPRLILLIGVAISLVYCSCSNDNDGSTIIITPNLPKLDCKRRLEKLTVDFAARGLLQSGMAQRALEKEKKDCEAENKRRGY